jgi:peptidoglycan hydrolase CwlO-like protein
MKPKRILVIIAIVAFAANSAYQTWEIHQLKLSVMNVDSNVDDLDTKISDVAGDVVNLQSDITDLGEKVETVQDKLNVN